MEFRIEKYAMFIMKNVKEKQKDLPTQYGKQSILVKKKNTTLIY